jgi:hypothetical protein
MGPQAEVEAQAFRDLHACCGFVANGSDTTVKISQDDATGTFVVYVGNRRYWGETLAETLAKARADRNA